MSIPAEGGPSGVTRAEATRVWARVACQSFGGPVGQIAVMHRILVEEKRWISEERFLHALNFCMLLPGPEAQQLATYVGWLLHGTRGGLIAGTLFVLPGFLAILALSLVYVYAGDAELVAGLFFGLKAAVLALVVEALVRIGKRVLKTPLHVGLAAAAFLALFLGHAPFPLIVLGAGVLGFAGGRLAPDLFVLPAGGSAQPEEHLERLRVRPTLARSARVLLVSCALWFVPLLLLGLALGRDHVVVREGVFFSKVAMLTFGGAYAVLAYVAQAAVEGYGWLTPGEMLDGLGLAETTPGPLIMVVQFVAFLGAFREPGALTPLAAALLGSVVTTWVTFVPCFLWVFLGAPYVEALRGRRDLSAALAAITAAVVGVIANLALWFALHTLFHGVREHAWIGLRLTLPDWSTVDVPALLLALGSLVAVLRFKVGLAPLLVTCCALGAAFVLLAPT